MTLAQSETIILTVTCPAASGIVARISGFLAARDCYISEMHQFDDELTQNFFTRMSFRADSDKTPALALLRVAFAKEVAYDGMDWAMQPESARMKVVLMVSKADHCLNDLLYRYRIGELAMDIVAVVSNHEDLKGMVEAFDLPFYYIPVTVATKTAAEAQLLELVAEKAAELVVLVRYMQILSDALCRTLSGRVINIHHSFLPGFKGAKPYHQAHARGVKLIGATAHYVTADLDEGPIIEQVVQRVNHTHSPEKLVAIGRDSECQALARAVKAHIEHRVFLNGDKTIVFY